MKEFDKKKIIVFSVLIGGVVLIWFMKSRPGKVEEEINNIEVTLQDNSVIASKLAAYKKNRDIENRGNASAKINNVSFYESEDVATKDSLQTVQKVEAPKTNKKTTKKRNNTPRPKSLPPMENIVVKSGMSEEEKQLRLAELRSSWQCTEDNSSSDIQNKQGDISYMAVIHGQQKIINKGHVQIRLKEQIKTKSHIIPANTLITGVASINKDRVSISIQSVRVGRQVIPISLMIFGSDGLKGLPVQVDGTKQLVDNEVSDELINGLDNAAKSYTAGLSGIVTNVAKGLKKAEQRSTTLYDNTSIYIKLL